jgi:general secretion pathway protein N
MNFRIKFPSFSLQAIKKPYIKFSLLGIFLYLLFLITTIPAEWLAWGMNKYSHGSITLSNAHGTIWKGRGLLSVSYNRGRPSNLGHIEWNIHTLWLFTGRLKTTFDLSGKGLLVHTQATVSPGGFALRDLRASIQAENLASIYNPASLISPIGQISFRSEELSINNDGILGNAEGKWRDAGSALSGTKPLGTYNISLKGAGETAAITLDSSKNSALKLAGKGNWTLINGLINFSGTATPVSRKSELESLLILLGRDTGAGKRILRFSTRIPFAYDIKKK